MPHAPIQHTIELPELERDPAAASLANTASVRLLAKSTAKPNPCATHSRDGDRRGLAQSKPPWLGTAKARDTDGKAQPRRRLTSRPRMG